MPRRGKGLIRNRRISAWKSGNWLYSDLGEIPDETGTVCALSDSVISSDRVGGEGLSHGASADGTHRAVRIVKFMQSLNFEEAIRKIVAADSRYEFEAYVFVQ